MRPTPHQLNYIMRLLGTTNISLAWREIGRTMNVGPTQAKKYGTAGDASRTIERLEKK